MTWQGSEFLGLVHLQCYYSTLGLGQVFTITPLPFTDHAREEQERIPPLFMDEEDMDTKPSSNNVSHYHHSSAISFAGSGPCGSSLWATCTSPRHHLDDRWPPLLSIQPPEPFLSCPTELLEEPKEEDGEGFINEGDLMSAIWEKSFQYDDLSIVPAWDPAVDMDNGSGWQVVQGHVNLMEPT